MTVLKEEPSSLTKSYKFIRRQDISPEIRMKIAALVLVFNYHGQVTQLSNKYSVSRSFIYGLKDLLSTCLDGLFTENTDSAGLSRLAKRQIAWEKVLNLRMIGKCSFSAISELMKLEQETLPCSVCFISDFLVSLGAKLGKMVNWQGQTTYACDEIFMIGHEPVLVTVDPLSSTILRMELLESLNKQAWIDHWQALRNAGILPLGLIKDEGIAMRAAHADEMPEVAVQTDTYHAVAHRLGVFDSRLEKGVDKAIEHEWERQIVAQRAISPAMKSKKEAAYEKARPKTLLAIEQYESFLFLYRCLSEQFNIFDHHGSVRKQESAIAEVRCALDLMEQLNIPKLAKEISDIKKILPELFNFLPKAQLVQYELEAQLDQDTIYFWTYAWQNDKKSRKVKNLGRSHRLRLKAACALELLQEHYQLEQAEFDNFKRSIFQKLDAVVQSSALVETINSLLRPYMNGSRNQLSQEQLNIIRFYLNHRVYQRGKRKGLAPIELLKGEKLDKTWLEHLLAVAA